ncbi:MAG: hypothetical protein JW959_11085 [Pirellulales bacterium]|nr:hypothetical protein [Pirellulales bacterium]
MDYYTTLAVSIVLLLTAAAMMLSHVRVWKSLREAKLDADELDYRRRQFRRRMQTSAMLGVLAAALAVGDPITICWTRSGMFAACYWLTVMLLACWIGLLALVDIWATKHYYGRLRDKCLVERAKLEAELRRMEGSETGDRKPEVGDRESESEK